MFDRRFLQVVSIGVLLAAYGGESKPPAPPPVVALVPAPDPCAVEAHLIARAQLLMKASPQDAADILRPCRSTLSPEALTFFAKVTADAEARQANVLVAKNKALATEVKARAAAAQRLKAESRKNGVYIGMTQQEVVNSSWGRPQSKNRTTNQFGVSEQWVYSGGSYSYFSDGLLTTIQN